MKAIAAKRDALSWSRALKCRFPCTDDAYIIEPPVTRQKCGCVLVIGFDMLIFPPVGIGVLGSLFFVKQQRRAFLFRHQLGQTADLPVPILPVDRPYLVLPELAP